MPAAPEPPIAVMVPLLMMMLPPFKAMLFEVYIQVGKRNRCLDANGLYSVFTCRSVNDELRGFGDIGLLHRNAVCRIALVSPAVQSIQRLYGDVSS